MSFRTLSLSPGAKMRSRKASNASKIPSDFAFVGWVKCNVTQHLT
ncbi:hypothetical protein AAEJ74_04190 [Limnospira fusiformis PMC 851.14]|uniref:Uncharacterized protein n=1 Tax=Limnospira fusiformis PMC 851.14 TaxID=2219512 RepID=A0ABU9EG32_LIMFS